MRFRRHKEAAHASTQRLLALFAVVLALLVLAVNLALAVVYRFSVPFSEGYPRLFFETNSAMVLLFVLGGCWLETLRLREGGAHVARMAGGRPAQVSGHTPSDRLERRLHNIVQEMALASRIAAPAAWVLPREDAINAFAAGWSTDDAVIAVTRGALERLTREELQGVIAHEFSHIVHGDTRLNMRLIGLVWGLQMVFMLGRSLSSSDEHGRRPAGTLFGVALMAAGSLGWAAGRLLQAAVSRQREFLADAAAVEYTRLVQGLGGALRKIAQQARRRSDALHAAQGASLAHLYLSAPGAWHLGSTHPPIAERLRRLYGRHVEPLPADPLPAPTSDEPLMAYAPAGVEGTSTASPAGPASRVHDALQHPAWHGAAAREQEALDRIDQWHGVGQCQAALWLLISPTAERVDGVPPHLTVAARRELVALSPASRLRVLELLVQRIGSSPVQLAALRRAAQSKTRDAPTALRWLLIVRLLRAHRPSPKQQSLDALGAEIDAACWHLATAMGLQTDVARRWQEAVMNSLGLRAGVRTSLRLALRLRRLSPMQRPRVARAWVDALAHGLLDELRIADTLQLACRLLDTPPPPALARRCEIPPAADAA